MLASRARRSLSSAGLILAAFAFAGGLAACSSAPDADATDDLVSGDFESDFADWRIKFDECMKDEGIELPALGTTSSEGSGNGETLTLPDAGSIDMDALQEASKTCIAKVGEAPVDPSAPSAEEMNEMMLTFAKCMRDAGYDYPDPVISEGGMSAATAMPAGDSPEAEAAQQCSTTAGFGGDSSDSFSGTTD